MILNSDLETTLENSKYTLSDILDAPRETKSIQQADSNLKREESPQSTNFLPNDSKVRNPTYERKGMESKSVSDASKIDFKPLSNTQQYNLSSNQEKGLNGSNFITLSKIPEEEQIEIIQKEFQLNQQGKISLKKYYESTQEYSLFQSKGYNIKYESIRRRPLFKQLKPSNI